MAIPRIGVMEPNAAMLEMDEGELDFFPMAGRTGPNLPEGLPVRGKAGSGTRQRPEDGLTHTLAAPGTGRLRGRSVVVPIRFERTTLRFVV